MSKNFEENNSENREEEEEQVQSCSLIKFQAAAELPTFSTLKCSLDLRNPPNNWLNGQIKINKHASTSSFTSFKLAFDFHDELNDVDVISDSENIKNLLKVAYNPNCVLSYFVHRVGNTLLIDHFNLHRYYLWQSGDDDWLKSFIFEDIIGRMKDKSITIQHKTKEFLEQKNLLSKFLYYSIEDSERIEEKEYHPALSFNALLPQPKREDICTDNHQYSRNVLWNFEDIRMLIGSDMQIFGNQSRPCISLRLRDMKQPINVLTGIDYWLDNLMCNVSEILMCFHQNGIVQKYEVIKTEDLPNMENSKFSPKIIRNVAQNILSFLKQNCTKQGHTYWIFKGKNDDVVKLYDLTTLQLLKEEKEKSSGTEDESNKNDKKSNQNPFTIPVAILLYTIARNLKYSNEKLTTKQAGNIKHLLDNCLKLLPKERYPQIITTSHYILSDIQIQNGVDPMNPMNPYDEEDDSDENSEEYGDNEDEESEDDLDLNESDNCFPVMQSIKETIGDNDGRNQPKSYRPKPLLLGNIQERSSESLRNIIEGLKSLKFLKNEQSDASEKQKEKEQIIHDEQNLNLLQNPDQAIPMGWNEDDSNSSGKKVKVNSKHDSPMESENEALSNLYDNLDSKSLLMKGSPSLKTWDIHLKVLLFEKASLAYACLTEDFYNCNNYGAALKNLKYAMLCQSVVKKYVPTMTTQKNILYGRAGDCFFQMNKSFERIQDYIEEFLNESELDRAITKEIHGEQLNDDEEELCLENDVTEEKMLELSCHCYEISLADTNQSRIEIIRRLGNAYNELGASLMIKAQKLYNEYVEVQNIEKEEQQEDSNEIEEKLHHQITETSYSYIMKAVKLFEGVNDTINLTICHLNIGRFYRLSAHINLLNATSETKAFANQKMLYNSAFESYNRALALLGNRKEHAELYDHVLWELSTTTFSLAKDMQENSLTCDLEAEREVLAMLMKALKLCDTETNSSRQDLYIFRAGLIHQRIASLYHQSLRTMTDESKKKNILQLCRLNYEKAAKFLSSLSEYNDYFKVQIERVALCEFLGESSTSVQVKIKNLEAALHHFIESLDMLKLLSQAKSVIDAEEIHTHLELFEKRLQFVLKSLTKLAITGKKNKAENIKKMFGCTLRKNEKITLEKLVEHLVKVLDKICGLEMN